MQKKWVYLNTAIFFMAVALVPSAVFVDAFNNYFGFLNAWSGGSSRSFKAEQLPPQLPKITFVKFSIRIPKAKIVGLSADFNKWQAGLLPLAKKNGNVWETTIPLPKGTYHYLFEVDGRFIRDPKNPVSLLADDKEVSVITVK